MKHLKSILIAGVFSMMTASIFAQAPAFDLKKGTVKLNSGHEMPILGIGTFYLSSGQAENSVYWALKAGMRLIDTARIYGNEDGVGRGIRRAIKEGIVKREEIFVTTKMWTSDFSNGDAAVDASLKRLGLDYIDLMILHHSQPRNDVDAYKAMERYFDKNLTFTHMGGKKKTREEFIGEIIDGTLNYFKVDTKDYKIQVAGNTARMKFTHTLTAKVYGISGAWTMSGEYTYKKRNGIWVRVE